MIFSHWSYADWDPKRWPNFHPSELASPDNGQLYWWPDFFDRLQAARTLADKPFHITSAHRSWRYNIAVGGAPRSQHKKMAVDISLHNHNRFKLAGICKSVGFQGMGYAQTFLHVDMGRQRHWFYGQKSMEAWKK